MRILKRLEVAGFKSFARKTVLDFPAGITAIVGPNGSGKTNLVDAFRWILGEKEAKHLRGDKGENLIFAGTPKKPAVSLAQVSLTLDNEKKILPLEFGEVVVSRKIDRSGASRYICNQSEILLRDLVSLFSGARLGSRGFTVVNQGESDIFVTSSPAERREMVEEIIGLKEFRRKKEQAENRLQATKNNLDKVETAVKELAPHLAMLRRERRRFLKRQSYEEELRGLENRYFSVRLAEISRNSALIRPPLKNVEESINAVNDEIKNLAGASRLSRADASGAKRLEKLQEVIAELHNRKSEMQKELGRIEGRKTLVSLNDLNRVKSLLIPVLEMKDLRTVKAQIQSVIKTIEGFFGTESPSAVSEKGDAERILAASAKLDSEIASLAEETSRLIKKQKEEEQGLRDAFRKLDGKKDELNKLLTERERLSLDSEKWNLALQELEREASEIGRSLSDFTPLEARAVSTATASGGLPLTGFTPETEDANGSQESALDTLKRILRLRRELAVIGEIDPLLVKEADETEERYAFLSRESEDLKKASGDLVALIRSLDSEIRTLFRDSLSRINEEFSRYFRLCFGGGKARLKIRKPDDETAGETAVSADNAPADEEGLDIELNPPKKKITSLAMLSGGEKSLVSLSALFALVSVNPPPFLILDEVDAALDEENAGRFSGLLKDFSGKCQFVLVTHNRATMEAADVLYGVTMGDDGVSKILSLKLS